ncbi:hypothetical protein ACFX2C_046235 [Malus domestica]
MGSVKRNRPDEPEKSFFRSEFEWVRGPKLGSGGFGSVYLATVKKPKLGCEGFPTVMAVRTFSEWSEQATESSYLYLFRDCPYVIGSYGKNLTIGGDGYVKYNVFLEYADGGTIGDLIKKSGGSGLCESDVRNYTKAILSGLEYIHESGYVHCDLKPENILLVTSSSGFVPKIGDFGLAKTAMQKLTCQGTSMYLSPEAVCCRFQEQPSDIWALGCVVLRMLMGRQPWEAKHGSKLDEPEPLVASKVPNIPGWLSDDAKDFLGKCLVRDPFERSTAAELLNHQFVTKLDVVGKVEPVEEVASESSSEQYGSSIPLESWNSEEAEDFGPILPVALLNPRPVIPSTVYQRAST